MRGTSCCTFGEMKTEIKGGCGSCELSLFNNNQSRHCTERMFWIIFWHFQHLNFHSNLTQQTPQSWLDARVPVKGLKLTRQH